MGQTSFGRLFDMLRDQSALGTARPPTRPAPAPYPGYQAPVQQQRAAGSQADAALAPGLSAIERMIAQAQAQAKQQGQLNTAAANAAAGVIQNGPSAADRFAQQGGVSDAFMKGYQDTLNKELGGGQTGGDASQVFGAFGRDAGNMFRTQGAGMANNQDGAVEAILGRGQLGQMSALAQGNANAAELSGKKTDLLAQRPGLLQEALAQIGTRQSQLQSADATGKYRSATLARQDAAAQSKARQAQAKLARQDAAAQSKAQKEALDAAFKSAANLSKSGMLHDVDAQGRVYQVEDEAGNAVMTDSARGRQTLERQRQDQINLTRSALNLRGQDQSFDQTVTKAKLGLEQTRLVLDQSRVDLAGRAQALREAKAQQTAARAGQQEAYGQAKDEADRLTKSGTIYTVARTKGGYQVVPALRKDGKPMQVGGAKPKKGAKGGLTANQRIKLRGRAEQVVAGVYKGGTDSKGVDHEPLDFTGAINELAKEGIVGNLLYTVGLPALNRLYKPGDRGRGIDARAYLSQKGVTFSLGPGVNGGPPRVYALVHGTPVSDAEGNTVPVDEYSPGFAQALKRAIKGS